MALKLQSTKGSSAYMYMIYILHAYYIHVYTYCTRSTHKPMWLCAFVFAPENHYGPLWAHMGPFGLCGRWAHGPYGPIWAASGPRVSTAQYGPLWTHGPTGQYWPSYAHRGPYGPHKHIWTHMDPNGPLCTHKYTYGPTWARWLMRDCPFCCTPLANKSCYLIPQTHCGLTLWQVQWKQKLRKYLNLFLKQIHSG
jgi:hypothetical protein